MLAFYVILRYNRHMKYSLGLDIGVTSVGWAVIDEDKKRIHNLGVRIFERAEHPKDGSSLAAPRREARSARRRLKRRRQRLNTLKRFFIDKQLLTKEQIESILLRPNDPYQLRVKALDERLTNEELFVALYHLAKRRGYKSNRKVEDETDTASENGRVLQALKANEALLATKGYRTAGEALLKDEAYATNKRNKRDSYTNSFARKDFTAELEAIIARQRGLGLALSDTETQKLLYGIDDNDKLTVSSAILYQRPFMTRQLIEQMVGMCTFEDGTAGTTKERRAPRASYSFEIFRLVSDLAHVVFKPKPGCTPEPSRITLSSEVIQTIINEAKNTRSLTYKKVRQLAGVSDEYQFDYVRGKTKDGDPYGDKNEFGSLKAYHDIKKELADLPDEWEKINNEDTLNQIAFVLTVNRDDAEMRTDLHKLELSDNVIEALLKVKQTNFKTFGHLSIKALQKITPYIINGLTYDKAVTEAGYDFRKKGADLEQITNPVVRRAISQTNKVVKAIERKYGKPYFIRVETARELAKNFKDRNAIERTQKENQAKNAQIIDILRDEYHLTSPTGQQLIKFKLYREQNSKSLYSGVPIDIDRLFNDDNAYQIDHIIPYSRSGNDSLANKALVTAEENQLKGNLTPFEAFGADENRWKQFVANVEATYITRSLKEGSAADKQGNYKWNGYAMKKKSNLLNESYKNDEWNARALTDTQYITKFISNYLRQTVDFAEGDDKQRVFRPNGTLTAYLRRRWGLSKIRESDVLHHAADAAIVAATSQGVIQQANLFAKKHEITRALQNAKTMKEKTDLLTGEITDEDSFSEAQREFNAHAVLTEKHFPEPWDRFREEVDWRTRNINTEELRDKMKSFKSYDEAFNNQIQPIFVSRMPNRKASGQAHKETIRSPKVKDGNQRTVRKRLADIKLADLDNSILAESDAVLYKQLKEILEQHGNDPKKAFTEPVYKNGKTHDKHGTPLAPVSTIKVYSTEPSGFFVNDGKAFVNNGSMVRLDVYKKVNPKGKTEHFFVPVYAHQIGRNRPVPTKILPAPKGFTDVDESFEKVTSLFPNDYVRFYFANRISEGYYRGYDSASGQTSILDHSAANQDKITRVSARSAVSIERYDISILGDNYKWI